MREEIGRQGGSRRYEGYVSKIKGIKLVVEEIYKTQSIPEQRLLIGSGATQGDTSSIDEPTGSRNISSLLFPPFLLSLILSSPSSPLGVGRHSRRLEQKSN